MPIRSTWRLRPPSLILGGILIAFCVLFGFFFSKNDKIIYYRFSLNSVGPGILSILSSSKSPALAAWTPLGSLYKVSVPREEPGHFETPFVMWTRGDLAFGHDLITTLREVSTAFSLSPGESLPPMVLFGRAPDSDGRPADYLIWSNSTFDARFHIPGEVSLATVLRNYCINRPDRHFLMVDITATATATLSGSSPPAVHPATTLPPPVFPELQACYTAWPAHVTSLFYTAPGPTPQVPVLFRAQHPPPPNPSAALGLAFDPTRPPGPAMITVLTSPRVPPKPSEYLAMETWHWLASRGLLNVIVLTKSPDVAPLLSQFPEFAVGSEFEELWNLPILTSVTQLLEKEATTPLVMYANGDVQFYPDLIITARAALLEARRLGYKKLLLVGQRYNVDPQFAHVNTTFDTWVKRSDLEAESLPLPEAQLPRAWCDVNKEGYRRNVAESIELTKRLREGWLYTPEAIDWFMWTPGTFNWTIIPPFMLGRVRWDNWLLHNALSRRDVMTVDATRTVSVIHMNHGLHNESASASQSDYNIWLYNRYPPEYVPAVDLSRWFTDWKETSRDSNKVSFFKRRRHAKPLD
ncbi:hypothetical protein PAPYR_10404 [Paratrimastix pyriformis]|uniref:Uncharacterized protein n=1 Tax=Paratrimastix pyriformis TaxID=342808 RepID=A0ABQ8U614_9EUKA|nr:hypothetical protein PAPYR_10404 [Paratrimastix pyriformis]